MLEVCKQHIRRVTERNRSQDRTPEKQAETSSRTRLSIDGHPLEPPGRERRKRGRTGNLNLRNVAS